jgi:hypothetical protein
MIEVQVANDNLLDIFYSVSCGFDRSVELVLWLVANPCEDVRELWSPLGSISKLCNGHFTV